MTTTKQFLLVLPIIPFDIRKLTQKKPPRIDYKFQIYNTPHEYFSYMYSVGTSSLVLQSNNTMSLKTDNSAKQSVNEVRLTMLVIKRSPQR